MKAWAVGVGIRCETCLLWMRRADEDHGQICGEPLHFSQDTGATGNQSQQRMATDAVFGEKVQLRCLRHGVPNAQRSKAQHDREVVDGGLGCCVLR